MQLVINNQPYAPGLILAERQPVSFAALPPAGGGLTLTVNGERLEPFLRPGDAHWYWHWHPCETVGHCLALLRTTDNEPAVSELWASFTISPHKLDRQAYHELLADLERTARGLVFSLTGAGVAVEAGTAGGNPLVQLPLSSAEFARLEAAILRIARRPHQILQRRPERVPITQVRDFAATRDWNLTGASEAATTAYGGQHQPLPATVEQATSTTATDIYENRLLKQLLAELARRLRNCAAAEAAALTARATQLQALPFLAEVGTSLALRGPTRVLQHNPDYRTVYQCWQALRRSAQPAVTSTLGALPVHELPRLYERWCALQLAQALALLPDAKIVQQQLVTSAGTGYQVRLIEDQPLLQIEHGPARLRLRYQPRYRPGSGDGQLGSLDRHTRIPDLALEMTRPGTAPRLWVCDAKYRLDAAGGIPADALADAYTYLGSIGSSDGTRAVETALLLYPGRQLETYTSGVGALPLRPGATGALTAWVADLCQSAQ